ncbi:MAG: hypothetical protein JRN71_07190, partial [Nitrososphaerota archaeon]|nr:hypothetical protein [Nitrososphaerota archaeon]
GSLSATAVAYLTLIPFQVASGNSWGVIVLGGSLTATLSVYLDLRLVYPLRFRKPSTNPQ